MSVKVPYEKTIVGKIIKWLNAQPRTRAIKTHGGLYGVNGQPDITGCIKHYGGVGQRLEIEVKRPGEEPRPDQIREMNAWRNAGAIVFVAHSLDDVKRELEPVYAKLHDLYEKRKVRLGGGE